jgi:hypothetical protein
MHMLELAASIALFKLHADPFSGHAFAKHRAPLCQLVLMYRWGTCIADHTFSRSLTCLIATIVLVPVAVHPAHFHVQGSNWSRSRFNFVTHTRNPPAVNATAKPADVWALASCMQEAAAGGQHAQQPTAAAGGSILAAGVQLGGELTASGEYVLYRDSNTDLMLVKSAEQGVTLQLASAESDVVTVAPVLLLSPTASSSSSSKVACAVVGLVNMLNPGGALRSIQAGGQQQQQQQQQRARSSDGSNNGSSGNDSGSWVIAGAPAVTTAVPVPDTAAADVGACGGPVLMVEFAGCGLLLLYSSVQPQRVLLDGEVVGFSFDASSSRLEVVVPITGTGGDLQHVLLICWQ